MKRIFVLLSLLLSLNMFSQHSGYALKLIDTLASNAFSGRGYVDSGMFKAARFVASEFSRFGLDYLSDSYYQDFNIPINTFPGNMMLRINGAELKPGVDYMVDPASKGGKGTFNVQCIQAVDLLNAKKLNKLLLKVNGKFLVIDNRGLSFEKAEKDKLNQIMQFLKYNPQVPTVGTLELADKKLSWYSSTQLIGKPVLTANSQFNLKDIETVDIEIENDFIEKYPCSNVIGFVKGIQQPDSFIVLTAHYDHLGMMGEKVIFPGANDNASGVAMLLNLAENYSNCSPKYSMVFIALAAEESGLQGAKYFVQHPLFDLDKIKFLINFDLAGTGDEGIKVVNGSVYKEYFDGLSTINQKGKYLSDVKVRGEACNSDHCMFYNEGVPCFYIYTLGGNKAYHDIYDVPKNLPLDFFDGYKKLMIEFIDSL